MQYFGFDRPSFGIKTFGFGANFDPLDLFKDGKQGVWYDPSDKSTLFQDVAGTVPVTKDGDPVALMRDKSGNGNHAVQTVSTARPIYKTDGILHWLKPDGVDDSLFTNYIVKPPMSLYVGTFTPSISNTSLKAIVSSGSISSPLNNFALCTSNGEVIFATYASQYVSHGISLPPESSQVVYVKGMRTSITLGAVGGASKSGVATGEWATDYMRLFYDEQGARRGAHPFYGLCLIEEDLPSDKSNQVGQYLAKKSGVTL